MSSQRPQDLVFTLFGEYLIRQERPIWVGSLIALLKPFRVSEGAVRTVLSRMTRKGWLMSRRSGRNSFYDLTRRGRRLLEEGERRIFNPPHLSRWDGRWCLVTYSVPEDVRHLRDRLRSRLTWMGFGSLGNGVWISPHDVQEQVAEMAEDLGLGDNLVCFEAWQDQADHQGLVRRCWDLPALDARYRAFLAQWEPELERLRSSHENGDLTDRGAYTQRFRLIREYASFPQDDPFLPDPLLPERWPGWPAAKLFHDLHDLLTAPADRYVAAILEREPALKARSPAHA